MRRITGRGSVSALAGLGFLLFVAWPLAPSAQPDSALVVKGGSVINPRTGTTIANATIVIEGDRIAAVGGGEIDIPAGARVLDAGGKFVLSGWWT